MNNEIKEILETLRDSIDDTGTDKVNFINWVNKIEDYITNLQEYYNDNVNKYEELLVKYSNLQEELEEQKRIEQADFKTIQNLEKENERLKEKVNKFNIDKINNENKSLKGSCKVLGEKDNNQRKELNRLIQENKRLKQLCDKYEEEHRTTFEAWQKAIKENERYKKIFETKEKFSKIMPEDTDFIILSKADYDRQQEDIELTVIELKTRNEKVIEYINKYLEREYFDDDILETNTIYNRDLFKVKKILNGDDNK